MHDLLTILALIHHSMDPISSALVRMKTLSKISNLKHRLPEILPFSIPTSPCAEFSMPSVTLIWTLISIFDPALHVLLVLGAVLPSHIWIEDNEASDRQALADDERHVLDAVRVFGSLGGLGDAAAGDWVVVSML